MKTTYADLPHKFEAGTPNICGGIAFGAALDYMNSIGFDAIESYEEELLDYATSKAQSNRRLAYLWEHQKQNSCDFIQYRFDSPL